MEKKILEYGDAVINERLSKLLPYIKHAKIGLIADTHFNIWQRNNRFFSHIEEMFEGFVDVCQSEAVDCIYILGDLFDAKHTVSTEGLTRVNKMIAMLADRWPMVIIPGNHDMAYLDNSEINLASNYKRHENIVVIDKPAVAFKFGTHQFFLPYSVTIGNEVKEITSMIPLNGDKVNLFSHFGAAGFKVHDYSSIGADESASQVVFQDLPHIFSNVFLGHYHGYQTWEGITYVSAPLQSRHGDEKSKHGFVVFDTKSREHTFFENKRTPRFITYELTKDNVNRMLGLKNHYIRIMVKKKVSKELIVALKRKLMKNNFEVKVIMDIPKEAKFSAISGWKEIVFHDAESLLVGFLDGLEEQGALKFNKKNLLAHLGIGGK